MTRTTPPWERPWLSTLLAPLGLAFGALAARRRRRFGPGESLSLPVLSVGNLTVGGTGKSPFVSLLLRRLPEGLRPALVLARGFGERYALEGRSLNDEGWMLDRRHPGLAQLQGKDRLSLATAFLARHEMGCAILDDGAQHLGIRRDLEILLFDAAETAGNLRLLPAGPWRERLAEARRADLIVLTRADEVGAEVRDRALARLEAAAPGRPIVQSRYVVAGLRERGRGPLLPSSRLAGLPVVLLSGIARPGSFRRTVEGLGARVEEQIDLGDHGPLSATRIARLDESMRRGDRTLIVTEKDAIRLESRSGTWFTLAVDHELDDGGRTLDRLLERLLS